MKVIDEFNKKNQFKYIKKIIYLYNITKIRMLFKYFHFTNFTYNYTCD